MIIVNYHQISKNGDASLYDLPLDQFEAQIQALVDAGFSFVTLDALLNSRSEDQPSQCAICFDDGRDGAYEHGFRILSERGIKGTWFVCSDWIDRPPTAAAEAYSGFMTWMQIAELARHGNVIGSHGKSHARLPRLGDVMLRREVGESKAAIAGRVGADCVHFSAPWGLADARVIEAVRSAGYATLSSTVEAANKVPYQPYRLRRIDASLYRSLPQFRDTIARHVHDHRVFNVGLLSVEGAGKPDTEQLKAIGAFDLAVCLDAASYALCRQWAIPCERVDVAPRFVPSSDWVRERHGDLVSDRDVTFTEWTLSGRLSPWTYLSSFLRGTNARR